MERDFLGIASKNTAATGKEEPTDSSKDSVPMRNSTMQWPYSNKVSSIPQFLSFKSGSSTDPLSSSSSFDPTIVQKNMNHYATKNYSTQQHFDAYQAQRVFPVSNQQNQSMTISTSTSPILQSHFGSMGQTVVLNSMSSVNSQPLGGVPVISHVPVVHPTPSSIVGTTELRNGSNKASGSRPAQLTIFYGGSVCVYDDVSPEKAQAIMLLAGNGSTATHSKPAPAPALAPVHAPTVQLQSPIVRPSPIDGYIGNKVHTSLPISGLPSPVSLASTITNDMVITAKPLVTLTSTTTSQTEQPKAVSSIGPCSSATLIPSGAVPQARKASLARFLEKRKERVMSLSPYNVSSKSPEYSTTVSDGISLSMNSFSSSSHQLALKNGLR